MREHVLRTIARYGMFAAGARVGVALSGGADSVCLLHLLHELAPGWGLKLWALHLNHGLRGAESDADERFCRELAARLGVEFVAEQAQLEGTGENLEQAAREARAAFFERQKASLGLDRIATGHTRSDQAETVLFRLLRGTGTPGLAAIRPVDARGRVRPLIEVSRADVRGFLEAAGIAWREDSSNQSRAFARNRIRLELLPQLEREWNPAIEPALARTAELAAEEEAYWEAEVERRFPEVFRQQGEYWIGEREPLLALGRALGRRLVRRAMERVRGDLRQIEFAHVEQVLALLESSEGSGRTVAPGVDVIRSFDWLRLARPGLDHVNRRNYRFDVTVPARVALPGTDLVLCLQLFRNPPGGAYNSTSRAGLDAARLRAPLTVRNWRPGDQYQPAGRESEQKLKTLFQESRIPLWDRAKWPIITCGTEIVWARRFGAAEGFVARTGAQEVVRVEEMAVSDAESGRG
jgi:tRNA(Ile)-lysidine synthase